MSNNTILPQGGELKEVHYEGCGVSISTKPSPGAIPCWFEGDEIIYGDPITEEDLDE